MSLSRRDLVKSAAALTALAMTPPFARGQGAPAPAPATAPALPSGGLTLRFLEGVVPAAFGGVTFTVPWQRGTCDARQSFAVATERGDAVPTQSWPLAHWPDGSVKWSAHAIPLAASLTPTLRLTPADAKPPAAAVSARDADDAVEIDTGLIRCRFARTGDRVIESIHRDGVETLRGGRLVAIVQDQPEPDESGIVRRSAFASAVESVVVEQAGPVRAVVRVQGRHADASRRWLPFTLRLYFHAGSDVVRVMHTFIYDGDEHRDFIRGLGLRFDVPMRDLLHDRHVRFVGDGPGVFAEAVRGITGLRRDPGEAVRHAQVAGEKTPPIEQWDQRVATRLDLVPAWGDYTLAQANADGFTIRKRTKPGHAWIPSNGGRRAAGVGYVGGAGGGVAFGVRDFWQKHPARLDVRQAHTDAAEVTMWLWSPDAPAMDLRFYHDGMGMDTYPEQIRGLDITYEDYEAGYGTPHGIARTSELFLHLAPATPRSDTLVAFADLVRTPPVIVCEPKRYLDAGVFGSQWTLPDRSTPTRAILEDEQAHVLEGYLAEVEQRRWYGFWDFGDVMHTYDGDRHVWRYDVGGYAWDNSELSPDLWLWFSFLRTGRADLFRLAEAMTRHTGEVDVYHVGRFKFLGTRHNVQHWGCSSKQHRISTAMYRRPYYFLTADERVGDLLREQLGGIEAEKKIIVGRKLGENRPVLPLPPVEDPPRGGPVRIGAMGWGHAVAAWLSEAERTHDPRLHQRIVTSMQGIATLPHGMLSVGYTLDIDTGAITHDGSTGVDSSHLTSAFGLPELCIELIRTYGEQAPGFADAWAKYCRLYNASADEKRRETGQTWRADGGLGGSYSRLTAFAAMHFNDPELAARAWREFLGERPERRREQMRTLPLQGPDVLHPIVERRLGTNGAAQNGLATFQNLAFIGHALDP